MLSSNQPQMMFHITPSATLPSILTEGLLPLVGPRSALLYEPAPAIYLFPDRASAEDALSSWMGDVFDEDEQFALLEIDTSGSSPTPSFDLPSWEWTTSHPIQPHRITVVTQDL